MRRSVTMRSLLTGMMLTFASCGVSLDSVDQEVACYDTGHGMKCVALSEVPDDAAVTCVDTADVCLGANAAAETMGLNSGHDSKSSCSKSDSKPSHSKSSCSKSDSKPSHPHSKPSHPHSKSDCSKSHSKPSHPHSKSSHSDDCDSDHSGDHDIDVAGEGTIVANQP